MEIQFDKVVGDVPVGVISIHGELDASNFMQLVEQATGIYRSGIRNVLLDLSGTRFVSSTGLVALHSVSLLFRGEQPLDPGGGWDTIQAMDQNLSRGMQSHVKLLNPQPRVERTLERTGLKEFFQIYSDREEALLSFKKETGDQAPAESHGVT